MEFLLGRPSQIRDEDIDREVASDTTGFPPADGLRAHAHLAAIMGQIVSHVFRTRRRRKEDADCVLMKLHIWKERLPQHLKLGDDEFASPHRSVLLLHLLHNQVLALLFPLLISLAHHCYYPNFHSRIYNIPISQSLHSGAIPTSFSLFPRLRP